MSPCWQPVSGCAFSSQTRPCVAQRVCPTPVVASDVIDAASSFRHWRLPTARMSSNPSFVDEREAGRVVAAVLEPLEAV